MNILLYSLIAGFIREYLVLSNIMYVFPWN